MERSCRVILACCSIIFFFDSGQTFPGYYSRENPPGRKGTSQRNPTSTKAVFNLMPRLRLGLGLGFRLTLVGLGIGLLSRFRSSGISFY